MRKHGTNTRTGSQSRNGIISSPWEASERSHLLTAHAGILSGFLQDGLPSNLVFFSSKMEHYTEESIHMACYVSIQNTCHQLSIFGNAGSTGSGVPKWKSQDPSRMYRPTAQNTSRNTRKMKPISSCSIMSGSQNTIDLKPI